MSPLTRPIDSSLAAKAETAVSNCFQVTVSPVLCSMIAVSFGRSLAKQAT
jgi:hypothetical protein